jgi:hypothetical protein
VRVLIARPKLAFRLAAFRFAAFAVEAFVHAQRGIGRIACIQGDARIGLESVIRFAQRSRLAAAHIVRSASTGCPLAFLTRHTLLCFN